MRVNLKKIRDFVCKGCRLYNGGSCIRSFEEEFILGLRVNMSSLSDFEKDLILLGKISCHFQNTKLTQSTKQKTKTERQHQRTEHYVNGTRVCREAFKFLHCISQNKLTALLKHYKEFGLTPRVKKSGGRRRAEKRLLTHEDICLPQRPPDVNPPGLDAEQQDYLFENICEHTKDISCPKPATAAERRDTTDMTDNTNQAPAAQPKKRERNSSLDQQDAELPQIKEEEVCSSQDGEQLVVKQETDDIIVCTGEERLKLLDNTWKPEINLRSTSHNNMTVRRRFLQASRSATRRGTQV
ncbi:uncharacterized protein LOC115795833 isoform X2 [Archocentrus centrarchus]|uniref:uncharacterized protein LOC115795833 isoform X2 n=1 Tax=Archocentrus centrarchus TaxID=63155 RepID=UPI0011E9DAE2|nr:uncharacterized protein LOC115795833 isoform X2 [Archocentrus centrarchus]